MARVTHVSSGENPRIKEILHLRKNRQRRRTGVFIAEGWREIGRAMAAGLAMRQLFFSPELAGQWSSVELRLREIGAAAEIYELPAKLLAKLTYLDRPEGLLAVFEEPRWELADLPAGDLWLIATGIEKPGNLGAMARTASAAGCAGLLVAEKIVDAFNPNAIRASTGAVFSLPIVEVTSGEVIAWCRERKIQIMAATPEAELDYTQADMTLATAIVIGAEHEGLGEQWKSAGRQVRIPMRSDGVDSLNASTAAAVLLFEARRQRAG